MATIEDLPALLSKAIEDGFDVPKQKMYFINEDAASGAPPNSPIISASDHPVVEPASSIASNINPATSTPHVQRESTLLFLMPAEVRNKIWRALLVTDKVYISFTNCRLLMAQRGARRKVREEPPGARTAMRVSQFDERHIEYYGVLGDNDIGEEADLGTYFSPRRYHDDWAKYAMRCLAATPPVKFVDSYHPRPQLDILLTCRQARLEAEPIFYLENCFTFCTCNQIHDYNAAQDITAAHAAHCFLQDRSPEALKEIKSIELHVLQDPSVIRTAHLRRNDVAVWELGMHHSHIFIRSIPRFQHRCEALPVARGYLNMLQTDQNSQTDYCGCHPPIAPSQDGLGPITRLRKVRI